MVKWFCSVFNVVMCRKRLSSPRCRSELIDSAWVVTVPGQKCIKKILTLIKIVYREKPHKQSLIKTNDIYSLHVYLDNCVC